MSKTSWAVVIAVVLAIPTLTFGAGAAYHPLPGQLYVKNGLSPNDGACDGTVELSYGLLSEQQERVFSFSADSACDVLVEKTSLVGEPTWRSVGPVTVRAWAWKHSWPGEDVMRLTTTFDYPVLPCANGGKIQESPPAAYTDSGGAHWRVVQAWVERYAACDVETGAEYVGCCGASAGLATLLQYNLAKATHTTCYQTTYNARPGDLRYSCDPGSGLNEVPDYGITIPLGSVPAGTSRVFLVGPN